LQLLSSKLPDYIRAPKNKKMIISYEVVETIRNNFPTGRFLKKMNGHWYELGDQEATRKVSIAFRSKIRERSVVV